MIRNIKPSAVREILKLTEQQSMISFAGGLPAEEYFPIEDIQDAYNRAFKKGRQTLQYGITQGFTPLRELIAKRLSQKNMNVQANHLLMTTGSQQAIDLLARISLDKDDVVLVERPTYLAALQVFALQNAKVISVACDDDGMCPEDLLLKINKYHPKLIYVNPTFSNPTGKVWSLERRKSILHICKTYGVFILEDDPYGELSFNNKVSPSIFSLEDDLNQSIVVYISTFSKILSPGMRIGWAAGSLSVIQAMTHAKQAVDLHSSMVDQQALYELLYTFNLDQHIQHISSIYHERAEMMTSLLKQIPEQILHWQQPRGGMFLWASLPRTWDSTKLLEFAIKEGVAFVPGSEFYADHPERNKLRINFSYSDKEKMTKGIERLMIAIRNYNNHIRGDRIEISTNYC